jgi:hypothetical protein
MKIVGCDLPTRYQQIAMLDEETGELVERRLEHENGEARAFYASLDGPARVGVEATGHTRWFERLLAELGHELWIGEQRASVFWFAKDAARFVGAVRGEEMPGEAEVYAQQPGQEGLGALAGGTGAVKLQVAPS